MIYVLFDANDKVVALAESHEEAQRAPHPAVRFESRWEWKSWECVVSLVAELHPAFDGQIFLPVDKGDSTNHRFDIIKAPRVGDEVSMGFNGDYYPVGKIESISASMKLIIAGGKRFYRRKQTAAWLHGKTFALIPGHYNERNPSF